MQFPWTVKESFRDKNLLKGVYANGECHASEGEKKKNIRNLQTGVCLRRDGAVAESEQCRIDLEDKSRKKVSMNR